MSVVFVGSSIVTTITVIIISRRRWISVADILHNSVVGRVCLGTIDNASKRVAVKDATMLVLERDLFAVELRIRFLECADTPCIFCSSDMHEAELEIIEGVVARVGVRLGAAKVKEICLVKDDSSDFAGSSVTQQVGMRDIVVARDRTGVRSSDSRWFRGFRLFRVLRLFGPSANNAFSFVSGFFTESWCAVVTTGGAFPLVAATTGFVIRGTCRGSRRSVVGGSGLCRSSGPFGFGGSLLFVIVLSCCRGAEGKVTVDDWIDHPLLNHPSEKSKSVGNCKRRRRRRRSGRDRRGSRARTHVIIIIIKTLGSSCDGIIVVVIISSIHRW